jgi:hypothetical protein
MKVGIISMHRVINFGSFLQSYALKNTIESLGHNCSFIDIKPGPQIVTDKDTYNRISKRELFKKFDRHFLKRVRHIFFTLRRRNEFKYKYFSWLALTEDHNWEKYYDVVVIGSDEVFNCMKKNKWGVSPNLLGSDINAGKIITYAASCGNTTYKKVKEYGIENVISQYLKNINTFSARDNNTVDFIQKLTNKNSLVHLDPVLIYDFEDNIKPVKTNYNYVLIYAYDGRINDQSEITKIKEFAKKKKLKTISVGLYQSWCDKNISVDPFELLSYVKNAEYIVTDTFHGTIFSIKYNKPFATLIRESNKNKLTDLLERLGLLSQRVSKIEDLPEILENRINYEAINQFIENQRAQSIEYLRTHFCDMKQ